VSEPVQGGDQHNPRLDDDMVREPGAEEETPDVALWDSPGHDGVVGDTDTDPDRTDLRSRIGTYVSLVPFPTDGRTLVTAAEGQGAPDEVLAELRRLEPDGPLANVSELWEALDLGTGRRF
jgi:hypothetical protein